MYQTCITKNGYRINKNLYSKKIIDEHKKALTVKPYIKNDPDGGTEYPMFLETPSELVVPRYYGVEKFGAPEKSTLSNTKLPKLEFKGSLRDIQKPIVKACLDHMIANGSGGVLSAGCAAGKTTMSLFISCELKCKTLVVVNKTFLLDQWILRATQFTNARIGTIRQNKVDVKDKDIVIGMIQSIAMKEYDPTIFDEFGFVIYDECHHVASRVYSNALFKTGAKYTLGLSATPDRLDRLTHVIYWHLGPLIYKQPPRENKYVIAKIFNYFSTDKLFKEQTMWYKGTKTPSVPLMINSLTKLKQRDNHIVSIIDNLRKLPERKILILSGRIDQLKYLKKKIDESIQNDMDNGIIEQGECKTYYYVGSTKRNERQDAEINADILFSTFSMAQEGLDIERLNTVILATPKKDIVQSVGRIMRKVLESGDLKPLIVDFSDNLSVFVNQKFHRTRYYKQSKYVISNNYIVNDDLVDLESYDKICAKEADVQLCKLKYSDVFDVDRVELEYENCKNNDDDSDDDNNCGSKNMDNSCSDYMF